MVVHGVADREVRVRRIRLALDLCGCPIVERGATARLDVGDEAQGCVVGQGEVESGHEEEFAFL